MGGDGRGQLRDAGGGAGAGAARGGATDAPFGATTFGGGGVCRSSSSGGFVAVVQAAGRRVIRGFGRSDALIPARCMWTRVDGVEDHRPARERTRLRRRAEAPRATAVRRKPKEDEVPPLPPETEVFGLRVLVFLFFFDRGCVFEVRRNDFRASTASAHRKRRGTGLASDAPERPGHPSLGDFLDGRIRSITMARRARRVPAPAGWRRRPWPAATTPARRREATRRREELIF